jgi:hypothetical protein
MYSLISFDVAPIFRTTNLSQADNSPSATLSRIVLHRGGRLTPATSEILDRRNSAWRADRRSSEADRFARHRDAGAACRTEHDERHVWQRPRRTEQQLQSPQPGSRSQFVACSFETASDRRRSAPIGSATSDSSDRHSNAWSDYRRATAPHRTSTFRCRRRIPQLQRRARQRPARFRLISSRPIATHRPLFLDEGRPLPFAAGIRGYRPPNLKSKPSITSE